MLHFLAAIAGVASANYAGSATAPLLDGALSATGARGQADLAQAGIRGRIKPPKPLLSPLPQPYVIGSSRSSNQDAVSLEVARQHGRRKRAVAEATAARNAWLAYQEARSRRGLLPPCPLKDVPLVTPGDFVGVPQLGVPSAQQLEELCEGELGNRAKVATDALPDVLADFHAAVSRLPLPLPAKELRQLGRNVNSSPPLVRCLVRRSIRGNDVYKVRKACGS